MSVHCILSDVQSLLFGVPQNSFPGPLVFAIYTRPLGIIAQWYDIKYHLFADSRQLCRYPWIPTMSKMSSLSNCFEHCIADIRLCMTQNLLRFYDNKTIMIYSDSIHLVKSLKNTCITDGYIFNYPWMVNTKI